MIVCVEFDGALVVKGAQAYGDVVTPFTPIKGALQGALGLKAAGHEMLLYSARANRAARFAPWLDPLAPEELDELPNGGPDYTAIEARQRVCEVERQRFEHMVRWVMATLPNVFVIDDGAQGKPFADLYIEPNGVRLGADRFALDWVQVVRTWGDGDSSPIVFRDV